MSPGFQKSTLHCIWYKPNTLMKNISQISDRFFQIALLLSIKLLFSPEGRVQGFTSIANVKKLNSSDLAWNVREMDSTKVKKRNNISNKNSRSF